MSVAYSIGYACGVALVALVPVAVLVLAVPRSRRWALRPLVRRRAARRARVLAMQQARRDARTAALEAELAALDDAPS